jgi:hypothetical protein
MASIRRRRAKEESVAHSSLVAKALQCMRAQVNDANSGLRYQPDHALANSLSEADHAGRTSALHRLPEEAFHARADASAERLEAGCDAMGLVAPGGGLH